MTRYPVFILSLVLSVMCHHYLCIVKGRSCSAADHFLPELKLFSQVIVRAQVMICKGRVP